MNYSPAPLSFNDDDIALCLQLDRYNLLFPKQPEGLQRPVFSITSFDDWADCCIS